MISQHPYRLEWSVRARKISIRIDADGVPVVRAPRHTTQQTVERALNQASEWIERQRRSLVDKPTLLSASNVFYEGKNYPVHISPRRDGTVRMLPTSVLIAPLELTARSAIQTLTDWLRGRAVDSLSKRLYARAVTMNLIFSGLSFRQQRTRWGSCSSRKHISLNWRLIHAPVEVSEYVLIHELAHTVEMNHGKRFWEIVARYDPEYRLHQRWLSRYGSTD